MITATMSGINASRAAYLSSAPRLPFVLHERVKEGRLARLGVADAEAEPEDDRDQRLQDEANLELPAEHPRPGEIARDRFEKTWRGHATKLRPLVAGSIEGRGQTSVCGETLPTLSARP